MNNSSNNSGCLIWVIVIVAVIVLPGVFGNSGSGSANSSNKGNATYATQSNSQVKGKTNTPTDPDANLTPKTPPQNGEILNGSEGGYSGVQVSAEPGASAYVKVKDESDHTVVGFFVSSGSTAEVYVPEGTYSVQFAMGETWYGKKHRFGSKTSFGQDPSVSLGYGDVITYTLQKTVSGNFSMSSLDESQF